MGNELEKVQKAGSVFATDSTYSRAMKVAADLASSDLVPMTYKNKPANCLIALDVARQVNSSPLIVMQNLNIILGKPSWSSSYIAGAIRSRFKNIRVLSTGTGNDRGCQVVAYDDNGNIIAEGARVTMAMAREEKWIDKPGSKWKTMPELMLQYRANAFFGRVHCPDVLIGLQSEYEIIDVSGRVVDDDKISNPFKIDYKTVENVQEEKKEPENVELKQEPAKEESKEEIKKAEELKCVACGTKITQKVKEFSVNKYGAQLCMNCQEFQP